MNVFVTQREQGQGLVEYALILMLVALVAFVALGTLGSTLVGSYYDAVVNVLGA